MQYFLSREFEKEFAKLPKPIKAKAIHAFQMLTQDTEDPRLHTHELRGKLKGYFSMNVTEDIRAVYTYVERDVVQFVAIGTHSKLYGK